MGTLAGEIIEASDFDVLLRPPIAVLQQVATQSTTTGGWTTITFDTEVVDTYSGHSTSVNTSRYTVQLAGYYCIDGRVAYVANSTGSRGVRILKNGTVIAGSGTMLGAGTLGAIVETSLIVQLAVSDYIEVQAGQNSGGSLSTNASGEAVSMMYVEWIRE